MKPSYKDKPHGGLTLFLEIDDVLVHTFICDENTGYIAKPTFKEPEHEFMLNEVRLPILVYERDHMDDLMRYLVDTKSEIETIVFTRAEGIYINALLKIIDPQRKVFDHVLAQNACYRLLKEDDDVDHYLKDISRFKNRSMARSVLADPDTLNFALTPENGLTIMPYKGENFSDNDLKDEYLLSVIDEIEELRKTPDVRPYLEQ
jgi:TFIIF-interacting CTD phosphatase-like protein